MVLADRTSGEWASAPLTATLPLDDTVMQLVFTPDTRGLLGRSYFGRWLWWRLPRETRSTTQLQQLLAHPQPNPAAGERSAPTADLRTAHMLLGATSRLQNMKLFPRVPIVYGRDMMQSWADVGDTLPIRIAWVETGPRREVFPGIARLRVYATRLANPYPRREVASIAFSTSDLAWSGPKVFAVTLETGETPQAPASGSE